MLGLQARVTVRWDVYTTPCTRAEVAQHAFGKTNRQDWIQSFLLVPVQSHGTHQLWNSMHARKNQEHTCGATTTTETYIGRTWASMDCSLAAVQKYSWHVMLTHKSATPISAVWKHAGHLLACAWASSDPMFTKEAQTNFPGYNPSSSIAVQLSMQC